MEHQQTFTNQLVVWGQPENSRRVSRISKKVARAGLETDTPAPSPEGFGSWATSQMSEGPKGGQYRNHYTERLSTATAHHS